jgi:hypothetical protein
MNVFEMKERVTQLQRELKSLQQQIDMIQRNCHHGDWTVTTEQEDYQEPIFDHYEGHGSDPEPVFRHQTRTRTYHKRTCAHCGKVETTDKMKPVAFEPDFGS